MKKSRRVRLAARTALREVVIVEEGRRNTGRLVAGAFVWTEEAITRQEWLAWCAAND